VVARAHGPSVGPAGSLRLAPDCQDTECHGKRLYASAPGPCPLTHLPPDGRVVWTECLAPLLAVKDLVSLASTCKALRGLAHEWPVDLDRVAPTELEAALGVFPRATRVVITGTLPDQDEEEDPADAPLVVLVDEAEMMRVLEERGQGLITVETSSVNATPVFLLSWGNRLPGLRVSSLYLKLREERTALRRGLLVNMVDLSVDLGYFFEYDDIDELIEMIESLQYLQLCPLLAHLTLRGPVNLAGYEPEYPWDEWPLCIPASVRHLHLDGIAKELMTALPAALQASAPAVETLNVRMAEDVEGHGDVEDAFASALLLCAASLRHLRVRDVALGPDVAPALAVCNGLERLEVPIAALGHLPADASFPRLTHLRATEQFEKAEDKWLLQGCVALWGLTAAGGLPALADLTINHKAHSLPGSAHRGRTGRATVEALPEGWGALVVRAFEAVAPTLRSLSVNVHF
jgi:hypothetical protein